MAGNNDTRRLRVVVTGDSTGGQEALQEIGSASEKSESKLASLAKGMAGFAGKGVLALGAVGAAAATMGFSAATRLEQVSVGFTTMLGSAEKAQVFLKKLQAFANTTPFEFDDVTGAAQKFLAMGFAAKDVIPMLTAVGDAVAAMGGSAENIDSVTTALSQMQAKGKVGGEEIMQLTEQGIPALQILADKFGVSTADMSKMITKGKVMSDKAIPAIIDALENGTKNVKGFGGMMAAQSETMSGKWSTFMDTLKTGLGNLATKFLPAAKVAVQKASDAFAGLFSGFQGGKGGAGLMGTFQNIGRGVTSIITAFKTGSVASDGFVGALENIAATISNVIAIFKGMDIAVEAENPFTKIAHFIMNDFIPALISTVKAIANVIMWFKKHETTAKVLLITLGALMAITKAHAIVMNVQAAGGLIKMAKNTALVSAVTRTATAVQWAWNGAVAAAGWTKAAAGLAAYAIQQKAIAAWTKIMTAAQIAWNFAQSLSPTTWIIIGIVALVAAVVILWKKSDTFRNWVMGVLWPSLLKAWNSLKDVFWTVVHAIIDAWNWLKNGFMSVWNAIWGFLKPIIQGIINFFTPLFNVIARIAEFVMAFYTNVWKVVWILIQIAVKVFAFYFQNVIMPILRGIFAVLSAIVGAFVAFFKVQWDFAMLVLKTVIGWIMGTLVPSFQRAWDQLKTALNGVKNFFVAVWTAIENRVRAVFNAIAGPIAAILSRAIAIFKGYLSTLKSYWSGVFDSVKNKTSSVMDAIVKAFNKGKDGIKAAWDKVVTTAKTPINFVINEVYNKRIRALWNKVAERFGISTRLDEIKGFAKGGVVGQGYGQRDDQLALLMRGEGVLTTSEMKKIGGPGGFQEFRKSLAMYGNGGVVGGDGPGSWFSSLASKGKDIIQGIAGSAIKPLVSTLRQFINNHLQGGGMSGLMRGGSNVILDKLVSWVAGKDKDIGAIGGAGGAIGWRAMQALIKGAFPGLHMISGFRPGARTLSGNQSYHALGRAVDYPANRALALWIRSKYGSKTKELITPWNNLNLHNGKPHKYTGAVWNQHNFAGGNAHDHWAMDGVSRVQPGWFSGYNGTGKPETLVNKDLIAGVTINGGLHLHGVQDVKGLRDELLKLAKRNGGTSGLPKK
jgi:tape measure domain-containing protein